MKSLLLLLLIPFTNPPIGYRQLTWGDYKGMPPANINADACTCTNIVIGIDTAYAIFDPRRSWTKTNNAELLRHEQLHFAITKHWADKINMWRPYDLVEHEFNRNIPYYLDQWSLMEARYDCETNHGTDTLQQKRWEELIKL